MVARGVGDVGIKHKWQTLKDTNLQSPNIWNMGMKYSVRNVVNNYVMSLYGDS